MVAVFTTTLATPGVRSTAGPWMLAAGSLRTVADTYATRGPASCRGAAVPCRESARRCPRPASGSACPQLAIAVQELPRGVCGIKGRRNAFPGAASQLPSLGGSCQQLPDRLGEGRRRVGGDENGSGFARGKNLAGTSYVRGDNRHSRRAGLQQNAPPGAPAAPACA